MLLFVLVLVAFEAALSLAPWHEGAMAAAGAPAVEATAAQPGAPKLTVADYPRYRGFNSRLTVWIAAQLHLFFAAFVLGVPIFVLVIEFIGWRNGDPRYDRMAHEFIKISMGAFSLTATSGGILVFALAVFYPGLFAYLTRIFGPVMMLYALLFLAETACLYAYYYGWDSMQGRRKPGHLLLGLALNVVGTLLMGLSNSWATFMMAPSGVDSQGVFAGNVWVAVAGPLWTPLNVHRFLANIAYGGAIVGAYAAYKFIAARASEAKAHYDWMGHTANGIAVVAMLPLPFAGYWMTKEIYAYSQQMGITLMGGVFAWLFIIQAVLIGTIFLAANFYLWCGMARLDGANRTAHLVKYIAGVLVICFLVWFTPHTLVMTARELATIGGAYHPVLGPLGVMSAKNTAVNIMILATFFTYQLFRRSMVHSTRPWMARASRFQVALYVAAVANIIWLGVYGYFVPANIRIGLSVPQVMTTLLVIIVCIVVDEVIASRSKRIGAVHWGRMPARAQYALFTLAVAFTWLMGLMGYIRSSIRQHWHVYTVMRDGSVDAFTPTIGHATAIVSVCTLLFLALILFVFWLSGLSRAREAPAGLAEAGATP
ncbi:MAG: cytochrome ubiquinol oxidase subunit I [Rhodospirillales bacterium]|nr:cytochrome ubiquinol oxidase subunit I [Rhodospirillales bacterium]